MAQEAEAAPLSTYHRQLLSANYGVLLDSINTGMIIPYLVQNGVLTIPEVDRVRDEKGNDKNACIISFLYRKPDAIYPIFLRSLRESKHEHVANVLETPPNAPFNTPACVTTRVPSLSSGTSLCSQMCDKGSVDLRISVTVENSDSDGPRPVTLPNMGLQSITADKPINSCGSHSIQKGDMVNGKNSTLQMNARKGAQSSPSHDFTYTTLGLDDTNLPDFQQNTAPVLVESTSYHVNSPYKLSSFDAGGKYDESIITAKKIPNNLTDCEDAMDTGEPGATALSHPLSDFSNYLFMTDPFHSENCPPVTAQYPHNCIKEGSNFGTRTENAATRRCPSSAECFCTGCLEAQIFQTLQLANKKLQMSIVGGSSEDVSNLIKVIDRCFDWLNFLKTRGTDNFDVRLGCVILSFNCDSPEALDFLWQRWITGQLTSELQEIFLPLFEMQYPNSKVSIITRMCSHQYLRYRNKLVAEKDLHRQSSPSTMSPVPPTVAPLPLFPATVDAAHVDPLDDESLQDVQVESTTRTRIGREAFDDIVETLPSETLPSEQKYFETVFKVSHDGVSSHFDDVFREDIPVTEVKVECENQSSAGCPASSRDDVKMGQLSHRPQLRKRSVGHVALGERDRRERRRESNRRAARRCREMKKSSSSRILNDYARLEKENEQLRREVALLQERVNTLEKALVTHRYGNELLPELEALTDSLSQSQYEAAKLLEMAYCSISNFPELASEVRLSAHQARTSHEWTSVLMKKFAEAGNQIVHVVIPLILESIDIGDNDGVKANFSMIIVYSEEMKEEADYTRDKYIQLVQKLREDIEKLRATRKQNVEKEEDVALKKRHEEGLKQMEEENLRKWEMEKAQNERELCELRSIRQTVTQELQEGSNGGKTYMSVALVPVIGWAAVGIGLLTNKAQFHNIMQILNQPDESLSAVDRQRKQVFKEELEAKRAAQQRLLTIQQLYLKDELLGDESSLLEAVHRLGEADNHLDKLTRFWGDMAVLFKYLRDETVPGQPFLENIQNPACATVFKRTLDTANRKWIRFGEICTDYVCRCERDPMLSINSLYDFLDGRVDDMNSDQRSAQIRATQQHFQQMFAAIEDVPGEGTSGQILATQQDAQQIDAAIEDVPLDGTRICGRH